MLKLCELELIIPTKNSSVERLSRIKIFVTNSKGQEKLSQISLLSSGNKLIQNILEHSRFYDDIIDEYAKSDRRNELQYK